MNYYLGCWDKGTLIQKLITMINGGQFNKAQLDPLINSLQQQQALNGQSPALLGMTILQAASFQNPPLATHLLQIGADPGVKNNYGWSALDYLLSRLYQQSSLTKENLELLECMIQKNSSVLKNRSIERDSEGNTVLHQVTKANCTHTVKLALFEFMVSQGADPLICNVFGQSPLKILENNIHPSYEYLVKIDNLIERSLIQFPR